MLSSLTGSWTHFGENSTFERSQIQDAVLLVDIIREPYIIQVTDINFWDFSISKQCTPDFENGCIFHNYI